MDVRQQWPPWQTPSHNSLLTTEHLFAYTEPMSRRSPTFLIAAACVMRFHPRRPASLPATQAGGLGSPDDANDAIPFNVADSVTDFQDAENA